MFDSSSGQIKKGATEENEVALRQGWNGSAELIKVALLWAETPEMRRMGGI